MIGQAFNKWTVVDFAVSVSKKSGPQFRCRCACGNESIVRQAKLLNGESRQCRDCGQKSQKALVTRHGMTYSPVWISWKSMMDRTRLANTLDSKKRRCYAGRDIVVAPPLNVFEEFYKHMGDRPEGTTIDRIDNDLGYQIGNLRWATPKEQARNRRSTRLITFKGECMPLTEWARLLGITPEGLAGRLNRLPIEKAMLPRI